MIPPSRKNHQADHDRARGTIWKIPGSNTASARRCDSAEERPAAAGRSSRSSGAETGRRILTFQKRKAPLPRGNKDNKDPREASRILTPERTRAGKTAAGKGSAGPDLPAIRAHRDLSPSQLEMRAVQGLFGGNKTESAPFKGEPDARHADIRRAGIADRRRRISLWHRRGEGIAEQGIQPSQGNTAISSACLSFCNGSPAAPRRCMKPPSTPERFLFGGRNRSRCPHTASLLARWSRSFLTFAVSATTVRAQTTVTSEPSRQTSRLPTACRSW